MQHENATRNCQTRKTNSSHVFILKWLKLHVFLLTFRTLCGIMRVVKRKGGRILKKEIYRSFEGKLDPDTRSGYVIYETNNFYEINFLSVYSEIGTQKIRVPKTTKFEFDNLEQISEIQEDVENGCRDGQAYYKEKWYSQQTINKIQKNNSDYNWRRYV